MVIKRIRKMGIREQILISFALVTIISLSIIAVITGIFVVVINNDASNETTSSLEEQVQYDMLNKTESYSLIIEDQLEHIESDINSLAQSISDVFKNPFEFGYRKSYYHVDTLPAGTILFNNTLITTDLNFPENIPPGAAYDSKLDLVTSYSYSHYLIYKDTYLQMGSNEYNFSGIHGEIINRTAHLDPIMSELMNRNPQYAWIYMDFEIGVQRTLPWSGVDTTVFGPEFHDYKDDDWYIDAKNSNGAVVWTAPYIDPYIGWTVSISRGVYNDTTFIGVVGIDFTLDSITETIGDIKLFDSGYGFLIDQEGTVISHPDVEFDPEEEAPNIIDVEPISEDLLDDMVKGESGFAEVSEDDNTFYLTYEPIPIADYILGIIVPSDEVLQPVEDLKAKIASNFAIQITLLLVLLGIIVGLALFVGLKVSDSLVKPIKRLTNLALQLSTEDVKKTILEKSDKLEELNDLIKQDDEIAGLARSFKNLALTIKEDSAQKQKGDNKEK